MNRRAPVAPLLTGLLTGLLAGLLAGCSPGSAPDTSATARVAPAQAASAAPEVSPVVTSTGPIPVATTAAPGLPVPGKPAQAAPFRWHVAAATKRSLGASWHRGCPVGPASLRTVSLRYWGFDGTVHDGKLVLHKDILKRARAVFATMYQRRFPLRSVIPVSEFPKASDDASMAADNTSAFNCRLAVASGRPSWSRHAYGKAIDVNPVENPYLFGTKVLPPAGKKYRSRTTSHPGLIRRNDPIHDVFTEAGFEWGGRWSNPDYQHFERR